MKYIKIIYSILFILTLTACSSQSKIDINRYIDKINLSESENICIDDFLLTSKSGEYIYKAVKSEMMISVYCKSDGEITQIAITSLPDNRKFECLCAASVSAFTQASNSKQLFEKAVAFGHAESGKYKITYTNYNIGKTMIINYSNAEINTNENPTLKKYISEDDISRPALQQ